MEHTLLDEGAKRKTQGKHTRHTGFISPVPRGILVLLAEPLAVSTGVLISQSYCIVILTE